MSTLYHLHGRLFLNFRIKVITGLHIGGTSAGLEIGGVDNPIIRNPITNEPYIPGSSLRGKMRSLLEKANNKDQNKSVGSKVKIHICEDPQEYDKDGGCLICHLFGVPGEGKVKGQTLLLARDIPLSQESIDELKNAYVDLDFTELKTEVAIDRVTSAATPRTVERVPAGAVFAPAELVFSIYQPDDFNRLRHVIDGLQLLEDDYLGGYGSRGSGKIKFEQFIVNARKSSDYGKLETLGKYEDLQELEKDFTDLIDRAKQFISVE